jgi:hypothetical protein
MIEEGSPNGISLLSILDLLDAIFLLWLMAILREGYGG